MDDINHYIAQARETGLPDDQIRQKLLESGWTTEQIDQSLPPAASIPGPTLTQIEEPHSEISEPAANPATQPFTEEYPAGFNWGAFWLTWIWGIGHGLWLTILLVPLTFITGLFSLFASVASLFGGFFKTTLGSSSINYSLITFLAIAGLNLAIEYWFGKKGNQWAWTRRGTRDTVAVKGREKAWAFAGWIFGILILVSWTLTIMSLVRTKAPAVNCAKGVTLTVNGVNQCQNTSTNTSNE